MIYRGKTKRPPSSADSTFAKAWILLLSITWYNRSHFVSPVQHPKYHSAINYFRASAFLCGAFIWLIWLKPKLRRNSAIFARWWRESGLEREWEREMVREMERRWERERQRERERERLREREWVREYEKESVTIKHVRSKHPLVMKIVSKYLSIYAFQCPIVISDIMLYQISCYIRYHVISDILLYQI